MLSTDPTSLIVMVPGLIWTILLSVLLVFSPKTLQEPPIPFVAVIPLGCLVVLCWRYISYRRKVQTYQPVEAVIFRKQYLLEYTYEFKGTKYRGTASIAGAYDESLLTVMVDPEHPSRSFIRELFCQPPG